MSWISAASCFNGLVCIGDIQATIDYGKGREKKYFNCIKKVHLVYKNLIVAFAGDICSGLKIIELLKKDLSNSIKKEDFFDLDGQTELLENNLNHYYKNVNKNSNPYVEFLFCWIIQEGDELEWSPFMAKFKSPNFKRDGIGKLQYPIQLGSGQNHKKYQDTITFLKGEVKDRSDIHSNVFGRDNIILFTVEKYKNMLINESRKECFLGVSKSFHSIKFTIHYDKLINEEGICLMEDIYSLFNLKKDISDDRNKGYLIESPLPYLKNPILTNKIDVTKYINILDRMKDIKLNYEKFVEFPLISENFEDHKDEIIDNICTTWDEFETMMKEKGIILKGNAQAIA